MFQAALLGGVFIGVLSALPIVNIANCCCIWIGGGGAIAAYLAQQGEPAPITPGRGTAAGLLAGIFGAFAWFGVALALSVHFLGGITFATLGGFLGAIFLRRNSSEVAV